MTQVLIVGAGPTGLVLALWLTKLGIKVRIIDKTDASGTTSRALAVHARTLELYNQLDLTRIVLKDGHKVPGVNLWVKGKKEAHIDFSDAGKTVTPFPFLHIFPQDEHEKLLINRLNELGIAVERQTELIAFTDDGQVRATFRDSRGDEMVEARYIAGCDGARSKVREILGTGFPGGTYQQIFYVADVQASGPALDGELHVDLDQADFLAVFPLKGKGRARLIGTVRDERADDASTLKFEDVSDRAIQNLKVKVENVNWFSTYHVHHRVTDHFRKGNAFLLGDAAHIHSPAGGQGMNTGIGDAINLAWKLKWVLEGKAPDALLDSYEQERIAFARTLVATTDKGFTFVSAEGPMADFVRTKIVPVVLPAAAHFSAFREFLFRAVSQTLISYRDNAFSEGQAGAISGGDRIPWISISDNYASLSPIAWQVHVYGPVLPDLRAWCSGHNMPLHAYSWNSECEGKGLKQSAAYLIRPDTYIAVAESSGRPDSFDRYFLKHGLKP